MKDLKGKVAVITGAASGIGRAMTDRFIAAGMKIVLADVDEIKLRNVEAELTENGADVFPVTVDVSLGESVEELARKTLEKYGAAHVLCNNAGVAGTANLGGGGSGASNAGLGSNAGGAGGKGVVILRTLNTNKEATTLTGGTVTNTGGYYIYTFNNSGTIGWTS